MAARPILHRHGGEDRSEGGNAVGQRAGETNRQESAVGLPSGLDAFWIVRWCFTNYRNWWQSAQAASRCSSGGSSGTGIPS